MSTFDFTWEEVITRFEEMQGFTSSTRSKIGNCMIKLLPDLQIATEERFGKIRIYPTMFHVELYQISSASLQLVVQCLDECEVILTVRNMQFEDLERVETDLSNAVEQTMLLLEKHAQQD